MPLKINQVMLVRILSYHQVMPNYLDFLTLFASKHETCYLGFSGFKEQLLLSKPALGLKIPDLGRSGRYFQLCYNLKSVECFSNTSDTDLEAKRWSIRHAAFYHQFDIEEGTTLWLVTQTTLEIQDRIQHLTGDQGRPQYRSFESAEKCFKSSLAIQRLQCQWSTEEWQWYIQWLENAIHEQVSKLASREKPISLFSILDRSSHR